MLEIVAWIAISFISGSVPWALIVGKVFLGKDVRKIGDGNPGTANSWKLGGWAPGMLSLVLDVGKAAIPVYVALTFPDLLSDSDWSGTTKQIGVALIAIAPVVGHGWSPFLKFRGGKALASSWGSWIGLTGGLAFPAGLLLLIFGHGLQRNHAITTTFTLAMFIPLLLPLYFHPYILINGLLILAIVIYKHRGEYSLGMTPRGWVSAIVRGKS